MRIAYVVTRADAVGGASIHVRDLAREVLGTGHEAMVFVGGRGPVTAQLEAAGVPFHSLNHLMREIKPDADIRAYFELSHALRTWRPDLVSTHTAKAGWLGRAAAARLGLPAIYTPHGWPIGDRISRAHGVIFTGAERLAARWAAAIICVSESERRLALARRIAPPERLHVIHNGVRDSALRGHPEVQPPRLVSVARFEAPKDHATLLRALAELRDLEWGLDLVGEGPLEHETTRLARVLGLADRVRFLGYRSDPAEILGA
ncbi:MAG TPA: glycosyltransferase, partial [Bryobacteraceae bacterium]|nr:glycosyltransferase [Bryobacteraceae bacterium]